MAKSKTAARGRKEEVRTQVEPTVALQQSGEPMTLAIADIDISPLNYRKFYKQQALEDFASELKVHGIIERPSVRMMPSGRYELVVGERRFRAAKLAGFTEIPVILREWTDHEVREMQLAENLQREDPHPLHEAFGIAQLQEDGKSTEEIAIRLGKSKAFVYSRIKLVSLIDAFQEMFLADVITITEASELATLSAASQRAFYEAACAGWKVEEHFRLPNLSNQLSRYRYDLCDAPFDTTDTTLLPDAGACGTCSFNSATLTTLFPELAAQAVCSNSACYERKYGQHFINSLTSALQEARPDALLLPGHVNKETEAFIDAITEAAGIPVLSRYDVSVIDPPEKPEREEYQSDDGDEETFDEEGYQAAVAEYHEELAAYQAEIGSCECKRGLLLSHSDCQTVGYVEGRVDNRSIQEKPVTVKQIEEAIKSKAATPEMLEAAIARIQEGEARAKELDKKKVQEAIHKAFTESLEDVDSLKPTAADGLAARLIIYQSLDYATRKKVDHTLFGAETLLHRVSDDADPLQRFATLTDAQHCYLLRMALAAKPESKQHGYVSAQCLKQVAEGSGIDLKWIQRLQDEKAENRWEKKELRIGHLRKMQQKITKQSGSTAPQNDF